MENKTMELTAAYFDSVGFEYDLNKDTPVIKTGVGGLENIQSIRVLLIFDSDGNSVHLIAPQIVNIPGDKREKMYKVINQVNQQFRWIKFYVDEDGDVMADADCILDIETCGNECFEIVLRTAHIVDEAYPILMKELWS